MVKSMFRVLVMSGVIGVFTTATCAAQAADQREVGQDQKSIVGSWIGINETGERWLTSFTSDGIVLNSVQSEVSSTRPVGVLTPGHGVWMDLGHRQFAITEMAVFYDIQTGEFQAAGKLRGVLTLDKTGDSLSGSVTADLLGPDGNLLVTLVHTLRFVRIKVEAVD
jgi:hypothetical protein